MAGVEDPFEQIVQNIQRPKRRLSDIDRIPEAKRLMVYRQMLEGYTFSVPALRAALSRKTDFPHTLDEQLLTLHDEHRLPKSEAQRTQRGMLLIRSFGLDASSPLRRLIDSTDPSGFRHINTRLGSDDIAHSNMLYPWLQEEATTEIEFMRYARGFTNKIVTPYLEASKEPIAPAIDLPQNADDLTHAILVRARERTPNSYSTYMFTKMSVYYGWEFVNAAVLGTDFVLNVERHQAGLPTNQLVSAALR